MTQETNFHLLDDSLILPELSQRQGECLRFIAEYFVKKRFYPTQREIAGKMGTSLAAIQANLDALEKKGYITRCASKRRNIRITQAGKMKLTMGKEES